jgi:hypothetical protein
MRIRILAELAVGRGSDSENLSVSIRFIPSLPEGRLGQRLSLVDILRLGCIQIAAPLRVFRKVFKSSFLKNFSLAAKQGFWKIFL